MSDVDDLVTWLRAQLDDDERAIRRIAAASCHGVESSAEKDYFRFVDRAPAEVDAKRRILDFLEYDRIDVSKAGGPPETLPGRRPAIAHPVLCMLALPYADRPGYRQEWAPSASA